MLTETDCAAVVTYTTVETCGSSVGGFSPTPIEYYPVYGITCKINICKKFSSPYRLSLPQSTAVQLYCPRLHQLAASTRLHVDQTCTIYYILAHISSRRILKDINQ